MSGEATGKKFMLATATVMFGDPANLFQFTPEVNSIGLVKNVMAKQVRGSVELTQGLYNDVVDSKDNSRKDTIEFENYEYSAKQLAYGLGLDGGTLTTLNVVGSIAVAVAATTLGTATMTLTTAAGPLGFAVGNWVMISVPGGGGDRVQMRQISAIAGAVLTFSVPVKRDMPLGTQVYKANFIPVGQKTQTTQLGCVISGNTSDGTPILLAYPKVRVVQGFSVGFQTQAYQNMPFVLDVFDSVPGDPHYALCQANKNAKCFIMST